MNGAQNRFTDAPVSLEDLAATFVDYAGLEPDKKWQAKSIRPILDGKAERVRDYVTSEYIYHVDREIHRPYPGSWHTVTDGRWKLVEFDNVPAALYDLRADPRELDNLLEREPEQAARLRQAFVDSIPVKRHLLAL
jgi:arylsulfatase A-like enzyme